MLGNYPLDTKEEFKGTSYDFLWIRASIETNVSLKWLGFWKQGIRLVAIASFFKEKQRIRERMVSDVTQCEIGIKHRLAPHVRATRFCNPTNNIKELYLLEERRILVVLRKERIGQYGRREAWSVIVRKDTTSVVGNYKKDLFSIMGILQWGCKFWNQSLRRFISWSYLLS